MGTHYEGTPKAKQALETYIKLVRASDTIHTRINRHLSDYNLTISQFGVLETLYHLGTLCQKDIAEKVLKSTGNITYVIDNLEKRRLVHRERSKTDRRYMDVYMTDEGHDLIENMFPAHVAVVEAEMNVLTDAEQKTLAALCKKLGLGGDGGD